MLENIERTSDTEKIKTGNELWTTFKDSVPSLQPQRDAFLSLLGQVLKELGFERVAFYKNRSRKVGYRGVLLKCRLDTVHSQSVENVKSWANSNLLPGSPTDSVSKDDAWKSFAKYVQLDLTESHRQQFFSIFGKHVAGQGPFKAVSSNKKRKSFVGLRLKESPQRENEPPPKRGKTEPKEEEMKHVGISEKPVTADSYEIIQEEAEIPVTADNVDSYKIIQEEADLPVTADNVDSYKIIEEEAFTMTRDFQGDWVNSDIEMTDGNSSDCMNEREVSYSARVKHDGVQGLGTSSGTETNAISAGSNVDVGDGELTIDELDEETADSTDEEVIDTNDIAVNALSSQGVQVCDEDVSVQETLFRRHHKKMKSFMPSHLPGRPKSFTSYLDAVSKQVVPCKVSDLLYRSVVARPRP